MTEIVDFVEFDIDRYRTATLTRRTQKVELPGLTGWGKGEENKTKAPVFIVQNVEGPEVSKALQRRRKHEELSPHIGTPDEAIRRVLEALGIDEKIPGELVQQRAIVSYGLVNPKMSYEDVKKFNKNHPAQFADVYKAIDRLSLIGSDPGELWPSGTTPE